MDTRIGNGAIKEERFFLPFFFQQRLEKERIKRVVFSRQKTAPLAICSRDICTLIRGTFVRMVMQ